MKFLMHFEYFTSQIVVKIRKSRGVSKMYEFMKLFEFHLNLLNIQIPHLFVQSRAIRSCSSRFCRYCVAILPTNGSAVKYE